MSSETQILRDAALRRIGRNLVNYQRLEGALRALIPAVSSIGTAADVHHRHAQRVRSLKKKSLGELANAFHDDVFGNSNLQPLQIEAPDQPAFSIRFRLNTTPEDAQDRKRFLLALVSERNRLVHSELLQYDFDSAEDCKRLSALLDAQNERLCQQLAEIKWIRDTHSSLAAEFKQYVDSDEFLNMLQREGSDA